MWPLQVVRVVGFGLYGLWGSGACLCAETVTAPEIPFNQSSLLGRELEYIAQTMTIGQIAGDRTYSKKCHTLLERTLKVQKALLTTSCTHALEICALLLDIQASDEVIVPAFAFHSPEFERLKGLHQCNLTRQHAQSQHLHTGQAAHLNDPFGISRLGATIRGQPGHAVPKSRSLISMKRNSTKLTSLLYERERGI